jgi:hypothetical protein
MKILDNLKERHQTPARSSSEKTFSIELNLEKIQFTQSFLALRAHNRPGASIMALQTQLVSLEDIEWISGGIALDAFAGS